MTIKSHIITTNLHIGELAHLNKSLYIFYPSKHERSYMACTWRFQYNYRRLRNNVDFDAAHVFVSLFIVSSVHCKQMNETRQFEGNLKCTVIFFTLTITITAFCA